MPVPLTIGSPSARGVEDPAAPAVFSYFAQRRAAGYIGMLLPVVVVLYDRFFALGCLPGSISASYYTGVRNFFVGSLCAVGVFLICSIGYKEDRPWSLLAGAMAFLVAFSPTTLPAACALPGAAPPPAVAPWIHGAAAAILFLTLAYFCLGLFVRTRIEGLPVRPRLRGLPRPKKNRNIVFLSCGTTILAAIAVFAAWEGIARLSHTPPPSHLLFVVEWVCLWAFGFAWLVKGQQLFKDADVAPLAKGSTPPD